MNSKFKIKMIVNQKMMMKKKIVIVLIVVIVMIVMKMIKKMKIHLKFKRVIKIKILNFRAG